MKGSEKRRTGRKALGDLVGSRERADKQQESREARTEVQGQAKRGLCRPAQASKATVTVSGFRGPRLEGQSFLARTAHRFLRDYDNHGANIAHTNGDIFSRSACAWRS